MNLCLGFRNKDNDELINAIQYRFEKELKSYNENFEKEMTEYFNKNNDLNKLILKERKIEYLIKGKNLFVKKVNDDGIITFKCKSELYDKCNVVKNKIIKYSNLIKDVYIEIYCDEENYCSLYCGVCILIFDNVVIRINLLALLFWHMLKNNDCVDIKNGKIKLRLFDCFKMFDEFGIFYPSNGDFLYEINVSFNYKIIVEYIDSNDFNICQRKYKTLMTKSFSFCLDAKVYADFEKEYTPFIIIWVNVNKEIIPDIDSIVLNLDGKDVCFENIIKYEMMNVTGYVVSFVDDIVDVEDVKKIIFGKESFWCGINFEEYDDIMISVNYSLTNDVHVSFEHVLVVEQYYYNYIRLSNEYKAYKY